MTARAPLLSAPTQILAVLLVASVASAEVRGSQTVAGTDHLERRGVAEASGAFRLWQPVLLTFESPIATAEDDPDNPFRDYRLNVRFTKPDGATLVVPGYFAADGAAADSSADAGSSWCAHLLPDQEGEWTWEASFRTGPDIAAELDFDLAGSPVPGSFDGTTGAFSIGPLDPEAQGHYAKGRLQDVGEHYFRFAENHEPFLKGGANSPENLLGYYEFDGTYDRGGLSPATPTGLHHFDRHLADFDPLDPVDQRALWQDGKGRGIVGAINYLAGHGIDGMYFLTYTIHGGDSEDTWVWRNPAGQGHKLRFDVSKLAQWERVFTHMDARGIQLHLVMQELENDQVMGGLGLERKLYYRELVARFAHHNAILWNVGEENTSPFQEQIEFAERIRALDPYDNPITVHTLPGAAYATYAPLYGTAFEATSIQGSPPFFNVLARNIRLLSASAGDPWPVYADEQFSPSLLPNMANRTEMRGEALWGNLMGGGAGVEWYFGFGDVTTEDFSIAEPIWRDTGHALEFFRRFVYATRLVPNNELTPDPNDFVLEEPGETYAVYRRNGGGALLDLPDAAAYDVDWFDPRSGGELQKGTVARVGGSGPAGFYTRLTIDPGGGTWIGQPPQPNGEDWVALVRKAANRPPVVLGSSVSPNPVQQGDPLVLKIRVDDPDGPDDVETVGIYYTTPGSSSDVALATHLGGDLHTILRKGGGTIQAGVWTYVAIVIDKHGAADLLPGGQFVVAP